MTPQPPVPAQPAPDPLTQPGPAPAGAIVDPRLLAAIVSIAEGLDLNTTLERIVGAARDLTGARWAALGVLGRDGLHQIFVQSGVSPDEQAVIGHHPLGLGLLGHITRTRSVVRTDDLTQHPQATGFPPGHPPMRSFLGVPLGVGDHVVGNLYLADTERGFTDEDEAVVVALAAAAAVSVQNAELFGDSDRKARWLAAAADVTIAMLSGDEDEEALELIARRAAEVVGADAAGMVLPGLDQDWVLEIAWGSAALREAVGTVMPAGGRTRTVLSTGNGLVVEDFAHDHDVRVPVLRSFGPALYAPLVENDRTIGVLLLLRDVGRDAFRESDLEAAADFARKAALSVRLAEGRRRHEEAELLHERARIARDLHDLVVQELFAMGMLLSRVRGSSSGTAKEIEASLDSLDRAVAHIRSTIRSLRDPERCATVPERLRAEVERAGVLLGFAPEFTWDLPPDQEETLTAEQADDLVAVLRESLTNAARHAHCRSVTIRLEVRDGDLVLEVSDDGIGLGLGPERRSGLANLAERARHHGGDFTARNGVGGGAPRGATMRWRIPLTDAPAHRDVER